MPRTHFRFRFALAAAIAAAVWLPSAAFADWQINLPPPASEIAVQQHWLHAFMMWVIVGIAAVVFGAMFYAIVRHRKSVGHKAAHFHENTLVEIIWTTVPMLIIIGMAIPATRVILAYKDVGEPDMTIKVTGYQWQWSYDYLDDGVFFYSNLTTDPKAIGEKYFRGSGDSPPTEKGENYLLEVDNEMIVPVGKKIRLLFTAADVIHAWWVPALGIKQDAVPGRVLDGWFRADRAGTYRGQCAELCGKNHAFMPIVVRAIPELEYVAWVEEMGGGEKEAEEILIAGATPVAEESASAEPIEWTKESLIAHGEKVYGQHCLACHQANGEGLAPVFPALKGSAIAVGDIAAHLDIVLNGKAGTAMASFNYLSDADLAAVVTYERNAWGNDAGDFIHPDEVKSVR